VGVAKTNILTTPASSVVSADASRAENLDGAGSVGRWRQRQRLPLISNFAGVHTNDGGGTGLPSGPYRKTPIPLPTLFAAYCTLIFSP
jgi:hypothetical protein